MKKQILLCAAILLPLASCVNHIREDIPETSELTIRAYLYHTEVMPTRATPAEAVTRLSYWAIDKDGNITKEIEQTSDNTDFGTVRMELPYGDFRIVVFGHSGLSKALIGKSCEITLQEDKLTDSFLSCENVTIVEGEKATVNTELQRRVAKFALLATDAIPTEVTEMEMRIEGAGKSVNAFTGLSAAATPQQRNIKVPASYAGKDGQVFAFYTFLPEESTVISVTATAKDSDGNVLYSHALKDIPMRVNQLTTAEGKFFRNASDGDISVTIDTDWLDEVRVEF